MSTRNGETYQPAVIQQTVVLPEEVATWPIEIAALVHPVHAGYNDPVSITCVLDCLLRLEHDTTIRTRDLLPILSETYPHLIWSPITIGRILSELCETADKVGLDAPPIEKRSSLGGTRYRVNPAPANWRWIADVRAAMGAYARDQVRREQRLGERINLGNFPHDIVAAVEWIQLAVVAA